MATHTIDAAHEIAQRHAAVPKLESLYNELIKKSPTGILSSRQPEVIAATNSKLLNVIQPEFPGVKRWYIPIAPHVPVAKQGTHRYYAYYGLFEPNASIPTHSHSFSIGELTVVITGALFYNGVEHTVGDWLWVPPGKEYSVKAGKFGAYVLTTWPATESTVEDVKNPPNPKLQAVGLSLIQAVDVYLDTNVNHGNTTARDELVQEAFKKTPRPPPPQMAWCAALFLPLWVQSPRYP